MVVRGSGSRALWHALSAHLLLIASALQGFVPDQDSLASLTALQVFCWPQDVSGSPRDKGPILQEEILASEPQEETASHRLVEQTEESTALAIWGFGSLGFRLCLEAILSLANILVPSPLLSVVLCRLKC